MVEGDMNLEWEHHVWTPELLDELVKKENIKPLEPTIEGDINLEPRSACEEDHVWTPELLSELKRKANIEVAPIELNDDYTDEQFEIYSRSITESDGFDVVVPDNMFLMDGIFPVRPYRFQSRKKTVYEVWSKYAIEEYNKQSNKSLEFVDVIKVNEEYAAGVWYYLTIIAQDKDAAVKDNAQLLTCRAKVWNGMWGDKTLELFKIVPQQPIQNQN